MKPYILHIPHSQTHIPDYTGFQISKKKIQAEINLLTDWATDKIFDIPQTEKLIVPFSRLFCDVERFYDEDEPMYAKGAGIAYTHTDAGELMRQVSPRLKQKILKNYYLPHQKQLDELAQKHLELYSKAIIIDCHSFSSKPLNREFSQSKDRPDICLGTDTFHTPNHIATKFKKYFERHGLSVLINQPYSGSMVPGTLYKKDKRVISIMIEINKKLYMNETNYQIDDAKSHKLNAILTHLCI